MQMRRGFSIFLIMLFALGPLSVMVNGTDDAGLPACCRRHGAHHCAMALQMAATAQIADPRPSFTAPVTCPEYPGPVLAILMPAHAILTAAAGRRVQEVRGFAPVSSLLFVHARPGFTRAGRGPPAANLV